MSVVLTESPSPLAGEGGAQRRVRGLSEESLSLWLAAIRHRQLADEAARKAAS